MRSTLPSWLRSLRLSGATESRKGAALAALTLLALVTGTVIGLLAPQIDSLGDLATTVFIRAIQIAIAPFVLVYIILAVIEAGQAGASPRSIAVLAIMIAVATSAVIILGMWIGVGLPPTDIVADSEHLSVANSGGNSLIAFAKLLTPVGIFEALARGDLLHIVIIGLLLGYAVRKVLPAYDGLVAILRNTADVLGYVIGLIVKTTPIAVLGAGIRLGAALDASSFVPLLRYFAAVVFGLVLLAVVFVLIAALAMRRRGVRKLGPITLPALIAFSTASSAAALPALMTAAERLQFSRFTTAGVIPICASFNMLGSTLFMAIATVFVVNSVGIQVDLGMLGSIGVTLLVLSKAIASVPRGSFVVLASLLATVGAPGETTAVVLGVLLGVDALLDMARTCVNVLGHVAVASVFERLAEVDRSQNRRCP